MKRFALRSTQVLLDLTILVAAFGLAFLIRFDGQLPLQMVKRLFFTLPYVVAFQYMVLTAAGIPRFVWRYVSLREVIRILGAMGAGSAVLMGVRLIAPRLQTAWDYAEYMLIPGGVILIDFALAAMGISGIRAVRRVLAERVAFQTLPAAVHKESRTLLLGAGQAGALVAREIGQRSDLGIKPVGFLDDDTTKTGLMIHGIRVLGPTSKLAHFAKRHRADQALISIASARGESIRRIVALCKEADLPVRIIPGIFELLDGKVNLSRIREVSIEDLLGRSPIDLDTDVVERFVRGKRVLVTGAGGSIGSELCRQLGSLSPESITLVERAEFHLFTVHQDMIQRFPSLDIRPRICDVCDSKRVDDIFSLDRPHVVFHAAAHKHVPMMEWNPGEAVKNNVFGTRKVADAADRHGTEAFVLISTDKAVNPTSIMGATKRVAEMYVQSLSQRSKTKYVAVRFGNVLGSAGSVIPIFKKQIETGGPVTVTHPDMKRYFMTIPEACQLVMQASAMGDGGEIFVLDMGTPVKIADLAKDLIRLSGFIPDEEIRVVYSGVRPGEKLFEELGFDAEKMDTTKHPKIFVGRLAPQPLGEVSRSLEHLSRFTSSTFAPEVRGALRAVVPEMQDDATGPAPEVVAIADRAPSARLVPA